MVLLVHGVVKPLNSKAPLIEHVAKHLNIPQRIIKQVDVVRQSVDARKRRGQQSSIDIKLVHNVHVELVDSNKEEDIIEQKGSSFAKKVSNHIPYQPEFHKTGSVIWNTVGQTDRPIVIGTGPAGLFAAYTLVQSGFKPIIIEMGPKVERRAKDLMSFWKKNILTSNSNGVFGEGGAGAFSDGKLTTRTSSPYHRFVHETLIKFGALPNILYQSRAHVGTDQLRKIITRFSRDGISACGGLFLYNTKVEKLVVSDGRIVGVEVVRMPTANSDEETEFITSYNDLQSNKLITPTSLTTPGTNYNSLLNRFCISSSECFLAPGHSSRALFSHLHEVGVALSPKDFAVGLRLQVSQKYINQIQYGEQSTHKDLGPAEFTLKHYDPETKRNVYTFCMCPGGVVVNASHGNEEVAVNGMSYSTRASRFANAAFVVNVGGHDFDEYVQTSHPTDTPHPLGGMYFQQYWERQCYDAAGQTYTAPAQRVIDFIQHEKTLKRRVQTHQVGQINGKDGAISGSSINGDSASPPISETNELPDHIFMGSLTATSLHKVLPSFVTTALANALKHFGSSIPGLLYPDSLLIGVETRTSSPVRIERDPVTLESVNTKGLYPVGEGAGYAGGIMTACVDGVRAVEAMIARRSGTLQGLRDKHATDCGSSNKKDRDSSLGVSQW